jgi:hypothetical protein
MMLLLSWNVMGLLGNTELNSLGPFRALKKKKGSMRFQVERGQLWHKVDPLTPEGVWGESYFCKHSTAIPAAVTAAATTD